MAAACVVLPVLTAEAMPSLLPASTALTLCIGVALAVAALSLNLLLGYAGQLSLGHAALLGVGAFSASVAVDRWELPDAGRLAARRRGGAAIALVIGLPALRLRGLHLALVTLAFGLTLQASLLRWQFFTRGSAGVSLPRRLWGDRLLTDAAPYLSISLLLLLAVWLLDRNVVRTKVGRAFQMLREDEDAAASFGIDVTRYKLLAFVLCRWHRRAGRGDVRVGHRARQQRRLHASTCPCASCCSSSSAASGRGGVPSRWRCCWPSRRSCPRGCGGGT